MKKKLLKRRDAAPRPPYCDPPGLAPLGWWRKIFTLEALLKIGINAVVERDMHALLATVQALAPEDLLLAISYSGGGASAERGGG